MPSSVFTYNIPHTHVLTLSRTSLGNRGGLFRRLPCRGCGGICDGSPSDVLGGTGGFMGGLPGASVGAAARRSDHGRVSVVGVGGVVVGGGGEGGTGGGCRGGPGDGVGHGGGAGGIVLAWTPQVRGGGRVLMS